VKQLELETTHSPPSCAMVKNAWSFTSTNVLMTWCLGIEATLFRFYLHVYKNGAKLFSYTKLSSKLLGIYFSRLFSLFVLLNLV